jgi:peptide/nickel transport system substrate-binding protein
MTTLDRREMLGLGAAAFITSVLVRPAGARAADANTLTIAFLPAFDPTTGPSAVNPTIQAIYRSIFDQFIGQGPDLKFQPGLLTDWGWNDDKTKVWMDVREGVTWHDGSSKA